MNWVSPAEALSLALTFPTIGLAVMVVSAWVSALKSAELTANRWFIAGVVIGFFGSAVDNTYWAFFWSAIFLDHPNAEPLGIWGVLPNIIFRQGAGITAAFCHLRAAQITGVMSSRALAWALVGSHLAGFAYVVWLCSVRGAA